MASVSEKLAANINFDAFMKAEELKKRIWFTLGALVVYRIGSFVPLPGIDPVILNDIFTRNAGGILGMFDMFAGGALGRMTIFALNIMPYISASIIMQLATSISKELGQLKKEGESGTRKINQYSRYLTVVIAMLQGYGIAAGLESMAGSGGVSAVIDPGAFFRFTTVITLVGGTMFIVWLGEQVTARGIGNGASLIITAGIIANLPMAVVQTIELGRVGQLSVFAIIGLLIMVVVIVTVIVFIERAQRRIVIQYPKRQKGNKLYGGESSHLPMKINSTGVIPPIFASSILLLPITIANFSAKSGPEWLGAVTAMLGRGQPLYLAVYSSLIIFFCFFYTAVVFNPDDTAENLKKHGGFVAGIRPGRNTAIYLDYVLTRLTVFGSIYLTLLCILPEILISKLSVPFYMGGTTLLITVTVTMDFVSQVQSHLLAHQYEGLIKKSKLRGRR
ncbi:MAG: preprotein translocase subunit SecY [Alphaproteobacteria bacterium]|nr:preprotein translocase subunit SecY [Alphaproteobacteria bacterium]